MTSNRPAPFPLSRIWLTAGAAALTLAGALAGCGSGSSGGAASTTATTTATSAAPSSAAAAVTVSDAWVKAVPSGMTAAFGTLTNTTDQPVTVTGASTPASGMVQLHEVVQVNGVSQMRPKQGGFAIPAHGTHALAPGGDHIMFMNVTKPITAGETVTITLKLSDGTSVPFTAVAKDFSGGNETYKPGSSSTSMPGMSGTPGTTGGTKSP